MRIGYAVLAGAVLALGCGGGDGEAGKAPAGAPPPGRPYTVHDTTVTASFDASGVAEPVERATLSTKLMGTVTAVLVQEGDRVGAGQVMARMDARDIAAKRTQVEAGIAAAEAVYQDALTQARRFRALYADSAATRYQLDQAETGLARAESGLRTARAGAAELDAMGSYSEFRAPFPGTVTRRFVDPGAFVAPGAPVLEVQNASRLRISVSVPPPAAAGLRRGSAIAAEIEGRPVEARVEGVVPAATGAVYTVNALVDNPRGVLLAGSAAVLRIPQGTRSALLVPVAAVVREGDLTGVRVRVGEGSERRWVRLGEEYRVPSTESPEPTRGPAAPGTRASVLSTDTLVEVLSGLRSGDIVLIGSD